MTITEILYGIASVTSKALKIRRIEKYINQLNKSELRNLALNLIYELSEYEFERFVSEYIDK